MTIITLEEEISQNEELLGSLQRRVMEYRRLLEATIEQTETGQDINETAVSQALTKMQSLAGSCNKAEVTLNECRKQKAGIAQGSYALDLGKARVDIGCKLDRLRRCTGAGPVSG